MLVETLQRNCMVCNILFTKKQNVSKKDWNTKYKTCSISCSRKLVGCAWLDAYKLQPGSQLGKATQFKSSDTTGKSNTKWKGDDASYAAKHMWVSYHYGKPNECESCGIAESGRMYHWSNISGEYKRERDDWQRLCVPCHKKYDLTK